MAANVGLGQKDPVPGESPVGGYLKTGETFYKDWIIARDASGLFVEPSAIKTLLPGGYVDRSILTAAAGDNTDQANAVTGLFSLPMLSTSTFVAGDGPLPMYFHNNREVAKSNSGRSVCGVFLCLDPNRPTTHCIGRLGLEGAAMGKALAQAIEAPVRTARGVVYSNVADLAAFTVAATDLTFVEGDRVLLAAQSTAAQCGVYVVGTVAAGVAPLTRAADMPAGSTLPNGSVVEISEGTVYAGSSWKAMSTTTGGAVIGTNDPVFYPRVYKQRLQLAAGTYTIGVGSTATPDEPLFLWSTTTSTVSISRTTAANCAATDGGYQALAASRIAGKPGTAVVIVIASVLAGTINNADTSTLDVLVTNW